MAPEGGADQPTNSAPQRGDREDITPPGGRDQAENSPPLSGGGPPGGSGGRRARGASGGRRDAGEGPPAEEGMTPPIQKIVLPCSRKKKTNRQLRMRIDNEVTITARAPKRSSRRPARIVATPATRFRAMPNRI